MKCQHIFISFIHIKVDDFHQHYMYQFRPLNKNYVET